MASHPTAAVARSIVTLMVGVTSVAACSDGPDHSIASYCTEVKANITAINAPSIATEADVQATLELYRGIGDRAPADVAPEWQVMIGSLETAATLVADDAQSLETVNDAALSSQAAATRIQQYTQKTCGADIGTPPVPTNPVTATTITPSATT
jgi:hypothetical protein